MSVPHDSPDGSAPSWECVSHNPMTWGLGIKDEKAQSIHSPIATVTRHTDGSHVWQLTETPWIRGHQPSRKNAMAAAEKEYLQLRPLMDAKNNTTDTPPDTSALGVPFDPLSWDHEPRLDGDGQFGLALDYSDIQSPPLMAIHTMHLGAWPDGTIQEHQTFAVPRQTSAGAREHQPMSVAETLWQALLSFCDHHCHVIHYDLRGGHRIRIDSGHHDGKCWHFHGASWEQVTKKAVLTLMPGYWMNVKGSQEAGDKNP